MDELNGDDLLLQSSSLPCRLADGTTTTTTTSASSRPRRRDDSTSSSRAAAAAATNATTEEHPNASSSPLCRPAAIRCKICLWNRLALDLKRALFIFGGVVSNSYVAT
jgi:hypothetical protein